MPKLPLPDEQPITVNALRNKRAEILGDLALHQGVIDRLRSALIHVDAVLRLFDPETNPEDIEGKRRYPRRTEYFGRGETTRLIYDALRAGETVSAAELAEAACDAKEIPETDRAVRREITDRFLNMLHHMRRRGRLEKIGSGAGVRGSSRGTNPI